LRFDDTAPGSLPATGQILAGTYKPTNIGSGDVFAAPAPAGPYGAALSVFNGTDANGDWLLYIMDDQGSDSGVMNGGWRLNIATVLGPTLRIERLGLNVRLSWTDPAYQLESATSLSGPWSFVSATSPATVSATGPMKFFRLRKP
jgi:hypothetical protein